MAQDTRRVQWWIPLVGLAATGTLITAGFGQSIESAVESEAREALDAAGLESVSADASYRDLELSGVASLEESARAAVAGTDHLLDVTYEVEEKDDGHHDDDHGHDDEDHSEDDHSDDDHSEEGDE